MLCSSTWRVRGSQCHKLQRAYLPNGRGYRKKRIAVKTSDLLKIIHHENHTENIRWNYADHGFSRLCGAKGRE